MSEIEAKVRYVKLARSLKTYGVSFFLVKVSSDPSSCLPYVILPFPVSLNSLTWLQSFPSWLPLTVYILSLVTPPLLSLPPFPRLCLCP